MNEDEQLINTARFLRMAFVRAYFETGRLSEAEAKELLAGPLTPGEHSTAVDDSALLHVADWESKLTQSIKETENANDR